MNDIKTLKIATPVKFGADKEIVGEITAITIRPSFIIYEIAYWKGDERKTIWLEETDIKVGKKIVKTTVGFIDHEIP